VSELVLDAVRTLGHSPDWDHLVLVAKALRESTDPEVQFALENYERFNAPVMADDPELGFTALDLYTEITSPGDMVRAGQRGRLVDDDDSEL
jgi:hypothetical protein